MTLPSAIKNEQFQEPPLKQRRVCSNIITETPIDDVTQELIKNLREGNVGTKTIELQGNAHAALLYLRGNPLNLPILQDDETLLRNRLSPESINLNYLAEQCNIKLVPATSIKDTPVGLWMFVCYVEVASLSFTGETEDEIHSFVETAITGPIRKFFGNTFRVSRNKALKTSSGRADYSISSDYLQLFRGEDKMRARLPQEDPAKELIAKSPKGQQWETLYGSSVPYIFGYYSIGNTDSLHLHFVCIPRNGSDVVHLTDTAFDLTQYSGILGCRLFCLSLVPHLLAVKKSIQSSVGLDWCITRDLVGHSVWTSSEIRVGLDSTHGDCCLIKDLYYDTRASSAEARTLVDKWQALPLPNMPHLLSLRRIGLLENVPEEGTGRVRRAFAPLCAPEAMDGYFEHALEAKRCILHVSKALKALHFVGLVHNDVRWANVVQKMGEQPAYVLIDYDDIATKNDGGFVPAIAWMDMESHAPDITSDHTQNVDLWGLCKMISELQCSEGGVHELVTFGRSCLQKYPDSIQDNSAFFSDLNRYLEN